MADAPNNSIPAAQPLSGPLAGLYKNTQEIAQDAVNQMKQIQAANAAQNALEGYTKGLNGLYTPVDELAKSIGDELPREHKPVTLFPKRPSRSQMTRGSVDHGLKR